MKIKNKEKQSSFLWVALRISFWIMIITLILEAALEATYDTQDYWTGLMVFVSILFVSSVLYTFIASIVHLVKYQKKAFAVTALVISSILVFLFFLLFLIGVIEGAITS